MRTKAEETLAVTKEELIKADETLSKTKEALTKTEETLTNTKEALAFTTGGDSYCILFLQLDDDTKNTGRFFLFPKGKYPLYDLRIDITDTQKAYSLLPRLNPSKTKEKYLTISPEESEKLLQANTHITIGNVGPNRAIRLRRWELPNRDVQIYGIQILARNAIFQEGLIIKRFNNHWKQAIRVEREIGFKKEPVILYEEVDPEFGKLDWSKLPK